MLIITKMLVLLYFFLHFWIVTVSVAPPSTTGEKTTDCPVVSVHTWDGTEEYGGGRFVRSNMNKKRTRLFKTIGQKPPSWCPLGYLRK